MGFKALIKKYILPKEIDFIGMIQEQSHATHKIIVSLYNCFIEQSDMDCDLIIEDEYNTQQLKSKNMQQLLNAFITPIDRESIYRTITQLDWIAISVQELVMETKAYDIHYLPQYSTMFDLLYKASRSLDEGFSTLGSSNQAKISRIADKTREAIYELNQEYIVQMVVLSKSSDFRVIFTQKEILWQLKEIGKRIHVCTNTLQDIVVKMD
ncbi:MAG: hypothetical protein IE909_10215 [Campylobacterales bacterium]|nr:hypothetical protein [Campylobacterales bacterium]